MTSDFQAARLHAEKATREVGRILRPGFGAAKVGARKSNKAHDLVTRFDTDAEQELTMQLSAFDSNIGSHGEELGAEGSTETFWLIDALDATGHFVRGSGYCTTMAALIHEGKVVASAIHDFVNGKTYSAALDGGATCDGEPLWVSNRPLDGVFFFWVQNLDLVAAGPVVFEVLTIGERAVLALAR